MRLLPLLLTALPLAASTVTFDTSALLTAAYANQLGDWLGEGNLTLTRIYASNAVPGTWSAFHAAADNQGRTFSVIEALSCTSQSSAQCITTNAIIGGYNPNSWNASLNGYTMTLPDSARTGFVFNLSETRVHTQILGSGAGQYQTYNTIGYGPTFGGGHDIYLSGGTTGLGYAQNFSYGPGYLSGVSIAGENPTPSDSISYFLVGRTEVFTIANASDVPEPPTLALIGCAGLIALLWKRRRMMSGLALAASAMATPVIDRVNAPDGMSTGFAISNFSPGANGATGLTGAQVFAAGLTGTLTRIDLPLWNYSAQAGTFFVEVWNTSSGTPVEPPTTPLLSFGVNAASLPTVFPGVSPASWTAVDVSSANLHVNAGSQYAIVVRAVRTAGYLEGGWGALLNANPYTSGAGYLRGANAGNTPNYTTWTSSISGITQWDSAFRTWVDADANTPEPSTLAMLTAAGLLAAVRRKRSSFSAR
ncbi:MAG: PEP_CTERM-anchored TLD domain-containing protein [Bryobacteraceae bacterium]